MGAQHPQVKAFRGFRYNTKVAGDIAALLAPPYDVIYPDMQEALYKKNPHNIVRLILGKTSPADTPADNRYTRSAADLQKFLAAKALVRDEKPAIYVYSQVYAALGKTYTRTGFIARKKLEDFGGSVKPHENTFDAPKADRLNLTRACKCNFSPIFGVYTDKERASDKLLADIVTGKPDVEAATDDGIVHRLWVVTDAAWIGKMSAVMEDKGVIIADGHHRCETALNYMKEPAAVGNASDDVKYCLMYFTNTESEGLVILPTHRVINQAAGFDLETFFAKAAAEFDIEKIDSADGKRNAAIEEKLAAKMQASKKPAFGAYCGGGRYALLVYKVTAFNSPLEKLDVAILHNRLLNPLVGVKPQTDMDNQVFYNIDIAKCAQRVDDKISLIAFFLNPTPIQHMRDVSEAGLKMPQKSTYFYPKLISGMVINPLY